MNVLMFSIANTHYAVSIASILQVIREPRCVDMPYPAVWFDGIITYKERIVPILDLKRQWSDPSHGSVDRNLQRTIVLDVQGHLVGLAVDRTYGIASIGEEAMETLTHLTDCPVYITGAFHYGETLTFMVAPEHFFSEEFNCEVEKIKSFHEKSMGGIDYENVG